MSGSPGPIGASNIGPGVHSYIIQNKHLDKVWVETGSGLCPSGCLGVTVGSDGNVWAADDIDDLLYQETMSGGVTEFPAPAGFFPAYLATGSDGDLYVTGVSNKYIVRMTVAGVATELPIPSRDYTFSSGIVRGSKAIWFLEGAHVGKVTPDGTITELPYPSGTTTNNGAGITIGPDERVWFVDSEAQTLGVVDQKTDTIVELPAGTMAPCAPYDIVSAAGELWVGCGSATPQLAKVTTRAKITYYALAFRVGQTPESMTAGPNGDPWMVNPRTDALSDFDPLTNSMTTYLPPPRVGLGPTVTLAPDGNVWIPGAGLMSTFLSNVLTVRPKNVTIPAPGSTATLTVKEPGTNSWTATTSDSSVATVAQGPSGSQFIVTGVASGACSVTVADAIGNSIVISVKVD